MDQEIALRPLTLTPAAFSRFDQVVTPSEDGTRFSPSDAQLVLNNGTPRLYIMRLKQRGLAFDRITRHVRVTQCLAAIGGGQWLLAVAPRLAPDADKICASASPCCASPRT